MTVNQTSWYKDTVNHFVEIGKEYRYINTLKDISTNLMNRTAKLRGNAVTILICKDANKKLKYTCYDWRSLE